MDKDRIRRLKKALRIASLDALILRLPENIVMSFGVWPMNGFSYGVFTAESGPVALVVPSCEDEEMHETWADEVRLFTWPRLNMDDPLKAIECELREIAQDHKLTRARIGYEGSFACVAPSHNAGEVMVPCETSIKFLKSILPTAKWTDGTGLLYSQRAKKTQQEIAKLLVAQRVARFGVNRFHESVSPGIREAELAGVVYAGCMNSGVRLTQVRHVNVYPQVSSGRNTYRAWRPVVTTGKRRIREGEIALLELAVCTDGFWADVTRVKVAGQPTAIHREAFRVVKAAHRAAIRSIRPGAQAQQPHIEATKVLVGAGFGKDIVHLTGHGVGFSYHEPEPILTPGNTLRLKSGHVCTVEPGLYNRSWGGIRLEDNVVVSVDGVESLTKVRKEL